MAGTKPISSPAHITLKIAEEITLGKNVDAVCGVNNELISDIKNCITSSPLEIGITDRKKKPSAKNPDSNIGIEAASINKAIRKQLKSIDNLCFETKVEYGGFFERNTKSDFDFSFYDRMYNYCKFWNHNFEKKNFEEIIKKTIHKNDKSNWDLFLSTYSPDPNHNSAVIYKGDAKYNIVGEIQMGNWAMIYKDIFRLLRAKNSPGVNLYIYITNTGYLTQKLSDNIVHYKKALSEIKETLDVIDTPILILGVDIDSYDENEFKSAHETTLLKTSISKEGIFSPDKIEALLEEGVALKQIKKASAQFSKGDYRPVASGGEGWLFYFGDEKQP